MRFFLIVGAVALISAIPIGAAEFLGVHLCQDNMETSVVLPLGSPLSIVSVEVGKYGALVIQFKGDGKKALGQVDDLMLAATGARGIGDNESLQWSGRSLTAFAEVIKKGFVALAVSSSEPCGQGSSIGDGSEKEVTPAAESAATPVFDEAAVVEEASAAEDRVVVAGSVAAVAVASERPEAEVTFESGEFSVRGDVMHMKAADDWVDVMGVVLNTTGRGYRLATFDLSFYDASGQLMCVDTISVSVLKDGQERAFRDSVHCPNYVGSKVTRTAMQFAGGY